MKYAKRQKYWLCVIKVKNKLSIIFIISILFISGCVQQETETAKPKKSSIDEIHILSVKKDCFYPTPWNKSLDPEKWEPPLMAGPDPIVFIKIPNGHTDSIINCEIKVDNIYVPTFTSYEYYTERGELKQIRETDIYILLNTFEVDGTNSHKITVCCENVCDTKSVESCNK